MNELIQAGALAALFGGSPVGSQYLKREWSDNLYHRE